MQKTHGRGHFTPTRPLPGVTRALKTAALLVCVSLTSHAPDVRFTIRSIITQAPTCLFNVFNDPTEHDNLAETNPALVATMAARLAELQVRVSSLKSGFVLLQLPPHLPVQTGMFSPGRGSPADSLACHAGDVTWKGFVGYFAP